ncbi:MAG TPA: HepT-like ribonuclease domain-containing protein [Anaerolineales bacterium]|jgi:uncharacterized protein with HEPN domain
MNQGDSDFLRLILDAITQIEHYTRGMSESEFFSRPMVQDAVVRQIEVVDEAARSISPEFQGLHPKLPWAQTFNARKKIVQDDFSLNIPGVWNAVQDDLPLLKQLIKKLV